MSRAVLAFLFLACASAVGIARAEGVVPYGMPIDLAGAKKAAAAAEAEARKITPIPYVIAIVDPDGRLIYFERMDEAQIGSIRIAIAKARAAALFRRPTKVFEDILAHGRTAILGLPGAIPSEGGVPLVIDGKVVGAIGASAGTPEQDGEVAKAGADAVK
jgi:glc operon protein GlcG